MIEVWLAVAEVAELAGISRQSVNEAVKRGHWHGATLRV